MSAFPSIRQNVIFLIDGIGALASAFFLGVVLVTFNSYIGMPEEKLYLLVLLAMLFACYSLACHFIKPKKWQWLLRIIATVNLLYCCLTLGLMFYHYSMLTLIGRCYFIIEIVIILMLVRFELKIVKTKSLPGGRLATRKISCRHRTTNLAV